MQRSLFSWGSLAQKPTCELRHARYSEAAKSIPNAGAERYTQSAVQLPAERAGPKVRAGFMLAPDSGASNVRNAAARAPVKRGVRRCTLFVFETMRTPNIIKAEIANSPPNAISGPRVPGAVTG